ncbi:hypothetical protein TGARI_301415, partial [Toxoplasma gondii ARI]
AQFPFAFSKTVRGRHPLHTPACSQAPLQSAQPEIHGEVCFQEQLLVLGKVRFMYVSERSGERLLCAPTSCLPRDFFVRLPVDPGTIFPRTADEEPKEPAEAHFYNRDLKPTTTERTRSLVASCVGTVPFECRRH